MSKELEARCVKNFEGTNDSNVYICAINTCIMNGLNVTEGKNHLNVKKTLDLIRSTKDVNGHWLKAYKEAINYCYPYGKCLGINQS